MLRTVSLWEAFHCQSRAFRTLARWNQLNSVHHALLWLNFSCRTGNTRRQGRRWSFFLLAYSLCLVELELLIVFHGQSRSLFLMICDTILRNRSWCLASGSALPIWEHSRAPLCLRPFHFHSLIIRPLSFQRSFCLVWHSLIEELMRSCPFFANFIWCIFCVYFLN